MSRRTTKINKLKKNIKNAPLSAYVVFSLAMVIVMTIIVTILTTIYDERFDSIYTVFVGVFGGEVLMCALVKIFKLRENNDE